MSQVPGTLPPELLERLRAALERGLRRVLRSIDMGNAAAVSFIEERAGGGAGLPWESQEDQRVLSELRDRDAVRARELIDALRRMESGTYGFCVRCDEAIDPDRLDVLPETPYCQGCAVLI